MSAPSPHRYHGEWQTVCHKNQVHAIRLYWDGFDRDGAKNWYIQLSDGRELAAPSAEFARWKRRLPLVPEMQAHMFGTSSTSR